MNQDGTSYHEQSLEQGYRIVLYRQESPLPLLLLRIEFVTIIIVNTKYITWNYVINITCDEEINWRVGSLFDSLFIVLPFFVLGVGLYLMQIID
jgi:hypothetical protein